MADKKFSPMRYSASTEEAAVVGALQIVGVSRDEIEYDVLETTDKGVTVRIRPRSSDAPAAAAPVATAPVAEPVVEEPAPAPEPAAEIAPIEESPVEEASVEQAPVEDEAEEDDDDDDYTPIAEDVPHLLEQDEELESDEYDAAEEQEAPAPAPDIEQDPVIVERAINQAQEFLDRMGLEANAAPGTTTDAGTVAITVEGEDVGILIGKHGATLQSFQYLLNLTLNAHHEGDGTRVIVDAGNYRARRQSSLEQTARNAASKARRENRSIRLEPMPAHERRLVHMFLQTEADIATQSEGREPMRRIVVSPASGGRPAAPRGGRSFSEGRNGGMGGYRRGDANSERNRGFNRGR